MPRRALATVGVQATAARHGEQVQGDVQAPGDSRLLRSRLKGECRGHIGPYRPLRWFVCGGVVPDARVIKSRRCSCSADLVLPFGQGGGRAPSPAVRGPKWIDGF